MAQHGQTRIQVNSGSLDVDEDDAFIASSPELRDLDGAIAYEKLFVQLKKVPCPSCVT